jgi:hypothetical protein
LVAVSSSAVSLAGGVSSSNESKGVDGDGAVPCCFSSC